jgi:hypothetical protein
MTSCTNIIGPLQCRLLSCDNGILLVNRCSRDSPQSISLRIPVVCCQLVRIEDWWVHFILIWTNDTLDRCHQSASMRTFELRTNFTADFTTVDYRHHTADFTTADYHCCTPTCALATLSYETQNTYKSHLVSHHSIWPRQVSTLLCVAIAAARSFLDVFAKKTLPMLMPFKQWPVL